MLKAAFMRATRRHWGLVETLRRGCTVTSFSTETIFFWSENTERENFLFLSGSRNDNMIFKKAIIIRTHSKHCSNAKGYLNSVEALALYTAEARHRKNS